MTVIICNGAGTQNPERIEYNDAGELVNRTVMDIKYTVSCPETIANPLITYCQLPLGHDGDHVYTRYYKP